MKPHTTQALTSTQQPMEKRTSVLSSAHKKTELGIFEEKSSGHGYASPQLPEVAGHAGQPTANSGTAAVMCRVRPTL
jgi:hypothetical protein